MGFLIAVDGVDSSGKQTQTQLLYERLKADNVELNFMCPNKSSIELFTKDVELEQTLKKIK